MILRPTQGEKGEQKLIDWYMYWSVWWPFFKHQTYHLGDILRGCSHFTDLLIFLGIATNNLVWAPTQRVYLFKGQNNKSLISKNYLMYMYLCDGCPANESPTQARFLSAQALTHFELSMKKFDLLAWAIYAAFFVSTRHSTNVGLLDLVCPISLGVVCWLTFLRQLLDHLISSP